MGEKCTSLSSRLCSFFPLPCYLVPFRPKYSPQHPILKHPQPTFFRQCERPSFSPIQNSSQTYSSVYLKLYIFWVANWKTKDSASNAWRRMRWAGHVARMGEERGAYRVLVGKPEGKRPLGRPRVRWVDNIRMDLQEVGCGYVDWIGLAQDRDRWRTLVSAVMNLRVP